VAFDCSAFVLKKDLLFLFVESGLGNVSVLCWSRLQKLVILYSFVQDHR
jgi:hypothetical protein